MYTSRYNIVHVDKKEKNVFLFSLLSLKMIKIPVELFDNIDNPEGSDKYVYIKKILLKNKFIFNNPESESDVVNYMINCRKYQSTQLNLTLIMGYNCNCKCIYCFERGIEVKSKEVSIDTITNWIVAFLQKNNIKKLDLCFHGGEPLLKVNDIIYICRKLRSFLNSNRIDYRYSIVTNGTLLTTNTYDILIDQEVLDFLIPIDGIEEVHNKRRPLKNGGNSFKSITQNLNKINYSKSSRIYISTIYDKSNIKSYPDLIDKISSEKFSNYIASFILSPVETFLCDKEKLYEKNFLNNDELVDTNIKLTKYIINKGFKVPFFFTPTLCTHYQKNSFVLNYEGDIYKCISGNGRKQFLIGNIEEKDDIYDMQISFVEEKEKSCNKCKFITVCAGGCNYRKNLLKKDWCKKRFP